MDTKDKLIEKLKEIFKYLNDRANTVTLNWSYYYDLRKEIDSLEKQVEEQEENPYLLSGDELKRTEEQRKKG